MQEGGEPFPGISAHRVERHHLSGMMERGVEWNRVGLGVGIRIFDLDFAFAGMGHPAALLVRRLSFLIFFLTLASAFLSFS